MTAWFELPNYRLKKAYVATHRALPMIFMADFKVGRFKSLIEKIWLFAVYIFLSGLIKPSAATERTIKDYQKAGFDIGLLYHTGWYKPADYIGICQRNGQNYFTKHFKDIEKSAEQITNFEFVNKYFSGSFLLPKYERDKTLVFYKFVARSAKAHGTEKILYRMLHCAEKNKDMYGILKTIGSFVPDDMIYQLHQNDLHKVAGKIENIRNIFASPVFCVPVHGDFTPWNIVIDQDNKVVLLDYERAGWHVFLYDCLHYVLQPLAFAGKKCKIMPLLQEHFPEQDIKTLFESCFVYLIDQIYNDLHALQENGHANKYLKKAILLKSEWLSSLLDGAKDVTAA